jgi:hypothetical protein
MVECVIAFPEDLHLLVASMNPPLLCWLGIGRRSIFVAPAQQSVESSIDAPGTAMGTGYLNTLAMLGTDHDPPAHTCTSGAANAAPSGGYSDWYLPSKNGLSTLFAHCNVANGVSPTTYWRSVQSKPNSAWTDALGEMDNPESTQETFPHGVRAIWVV